MAALMVGAVYSQNKKKKQPNKAMKSENAQRRLIALGGLFTP